MSHTLLKKKQIGNYCFGTFINDVTQRGGIWSFNDASTKVSDMKPW